MSYHQRLELKMNQFREDFKNEANFEKKLIYLIKVEFDITLNDILLLEPDSFIDRIEKGVYFFFENLYSEKCLSDEKLISLIEKNIDLKKIEYSKISQLLRNSWQSKRLDNKDFILTNFRKHCINTDNIAKHNCGNQNANFILVKNNENKINFVICESCKKVYYYSYICCHCDHCKVDYYTNILNENEDSNYLIATWEKYHCPQIINGKMKCIQCHDSLYINMKTGMLTCLNNNCNFISNPNKIIWTCNVCQKDFKSNAIPYNPLEIKMVKNSIRQTLLLKHRAHPNNLPCCKLNVFFVEFFHKKICRGILYEGELNNKMIIVCDKCHAINYYERFIWTCPKCFRRFKDANDENIKENCVIGINEYKNKIKNKSKYNSVGKDYLIKNYKNKISLRKEIKEIINNASEISKKENLDKNDVCNEENEEIKANDLKLGFDLVNKRNKYLRKTTKDESSEIINSNIDKEKDGCIKITINNESGKKINNFIINNNNISIYYSKHNNEKSIKPTNLLRHLNSEQFINNISNVKQENLRRVENSNKNHHKVYISICKKRSASALQDSAEKKFMNKNIAKEESVKKEESNKNKQYNNILKKRNYSIENIYHGKNISPKKSNLNMVKVEYQQRKNRNNSMDYSNKNCISKIVDNNKNDKKDNKRKYVYNKLEKNRFIGNNENSILNNRNKIRFHANLKSPNENSNNGVINLKLKKFINNKCNQKENEQNKMNNINIIDNSISREDNSIKRNDNNNIKIIQDYNNKKINKENICKNSNSDEKSKKDNQIINIDNKNKYPFIPENIGLQNLVAISETSLELLKLRINNIFSKTNLPLFNIEDYTINKKLGEGSFGIIYSAFKQTEINKEYALKKIIAKSVTELNNFIKEFELVYSCDHPNIMKIYGLCLRILDSTTFAIYVLMEKAKYDWDQEIKSHLSQKKFYTEKELINILKQLCEALLFLKNKLKITHRDIKPQNILVFDGDIYKLADFGEAKEIKISRKLNTLRGTELYMSPVLYEGLKNNKTDVRHDSFKSDVFSLGFCFLYAAGLNFNLLYQVRDIKDNDAFEDIINSHLVKNYSKNFILIVSLMLKFDETKRIEFSEILEFINKNLQS